MLSNLHGERSLSLKDKIEYSGIQYLSNHQRNDSSLKFDSYPHLLAGLRFKEDIWNFLLSTDSPMQIVDTFPGAF